VSVTALPARKESVARSKQRTPGTNTNPNQEKKETFNKHRNTHPSKQKSGNRHKSGRRKLQTHGKRKKHKSSAKAEQQRSHHRKEKRQSQQQHVTKTRNTVPHIMQEPLIQGRPRVLLDLIMCLLLSKQHVVWPSWHEPFSQ